MSKSTAKTATVNFLKQIEHLIPGLIDRAQQGQVKELVVDTQRLIEHEESATGLEYLLNGLYENTIPINQAALELAKIAIQECELDYADWVQIEDITE